MPTMRNTFERNPVVAVVCSDIHLSHKPPIARTGEKDWYRAMSRPLRQLRRLVEKHNVPVLCAGDIFDTWKVPPQLINFALKQLPDNIYAIPGQHDMPYHDIDQLDKSAYYTLVKAGKIVNVKPNRAYLLGDMFLHAFPWDTPIKPCKNGADKLHVALIHKYVWYGKAKYDTAKQADRMIGKYFGLQLKGYSTAIFGDNHKHFSTEIKDCHIFNCGTLIRRHSNEKEYHPSIGLLHLDGSVDCVQLDTSRDKVEKTIKIAKLEEDPDFSQFIDELGTIEDFGLDFQKTIKHVLKEKKPKQAIRRIILEAIGHGDN